MLAVLCLPYADASELCTDRSPAAVARALGIDLDRKAPRRTGKPNVLIIFVDDMGYADLSIYGGKTPTPNIDKLALSGTRFTAGYAASPICSPSRAGLMTGRQPDTLGYPSNFYHTVSGLPLSAKTIADYFNESGYATGFVGKWHLGNSAKYAPENRGFDEYFTFHCHGHHNVDGRHCFGGYYFEKYKEFIRHNVGQNMLERMKGCKSDEKYLTDVEGLEATSFILRHKDEPFLLYLATNAVHSPIEGKKVETDNSSAYSPTGRDWHYSQMLRHLDEAVGHVMATLNLTGLAENTLVWFFSDNGGDLFWEADNGVLRGGKGMVYEGGIRVPFMVRWSGTIPRATRKWPISTLDVLPTSLAAAGIYPGNVSSLSGTNMLPYLGNQGAQPPPSVLVRDLVWSMGGGRKDDFTKAIALRRGDWKLVIEANNKLFTYGAQLYNLKHDLSEQNNLADQKPEIMQAMRETIIKWNNALPDNRWE